MKGGANFLSWDLVVAVDGVAEHDFTEDWDGKEGGANFLAGEVFAGGDLTTKPDFFEDWGG